MYYKNWIPDLKMAAPIQLNENVFFYLKHLSALVFISLAPAEHSHSVHRLWDDVAHFKNLFSRLWESFTNKTF